MLEAAPEDGLPSNLCQACTDHMHTAYDFRSQAIYSERYFRNIIFLPVMKKAVESEPEFSPEADQSDESLDEAGDVLDDKNERHMECLLVDVCERQHEKIALVPHMKSEPDIFDYDAGTMKGGPPMPKTGLSDFMCDKIITEEKESRSDLVSAADKEKESQTSQTIGEKELQVHKKNGKIGLLKGNPHSTQNESKPRHKQKRKKVECNLCGIGFTHINSLKQHLNKHSGARPFQCEYCEKTFARRAVLNIHRRLHTGERPYQCDECIRTFITKDAMHRHKQREHTDGIEVTNSKVVKYTCIICNEERCSKNSLTIHMRTMHGSKVDMSSKSETCAVKTADPLLDPNLNESKEQSSRKLKRKHVQESSAIDTKLPEITYDCKVCSRSFEKKYQLLSHIQSHENGEFSIKRYLRYTPPKTQKSHEHKGLFARKPRKLAIATLKAADPTKLNDGSVTSRYQEASGNSTQWACPICRQEFSGLKVFKEHLRQHITARAFACELCGLKFAHSSFLKFHGRLHSDCQPSPSNVDPKPSVQPQRFQCAVCNTSFARKFKLHYHLELHKIQNARCSKCDGKFVSHEELIKHIKRLHFDKRNHDYQCPDCTERLYDMRDLKEHLNERHCANIADLDACDMCGVNFKSTREYHSHMYERHDTVSKYCSECDAYFESRRVFDNHILSHFV